MCYDTNDCQFLTYYSDEGFPLKHFCTLYKSCEETIECRGCVSETKDCFRGCSKHIIGCELATKAFLDDKQNKNWL